jgi:flagellar basal body-associated protein FliL
VPPGGYPQYGPPAPKKRGPLIALLVLAVVLLLCGGGGLAAFLLLRNTQTGEGAAEPVGAVDGFLTAVYTDHDATKAAGLVCVEARVPAEITKKVEEVKKYSVTYKNPRFNWTSPKVDSQSSGRAMVSVKLTMTTADEKTAQQQLTFTVVQKTGWWVCDVAAR